MKGPVVLLLPGRSSSAAVPKTHGSRHLSPLPVNPIWLQLEGKLNGLGNRCSKEEGAYCREPPVDMKSSRFLHAIGVFKMRRFVVQSLAGPGFRRWA